METGREKPVPGFVDLLQRSLRGHMKTLMNGQSSGFLHCTIKYCPFCSVLYPVHRPVVTICFFPGSFRIANNNNK